MITELFLDGFFKVADSMLGFIPPIEWTIDTGAWEFGRDALSMICWLLPMGTIKSIIGFVVGIGFLRIAVAVVRFILNLIPFVG